MDVAGFGITAKCGRAARIFPQAAFAAALPVLSDQAAHGEAVESSR